MHKRVSLLAFVGVAFLSNLAVAKPDASAILPVPKNAFFLKDGDRIYDVEWDVWIFPAERYAGDPSSGRAPENVKYREALAACRAYGATLASEYTFRMKDPN